MKIFDLFEDSWHDGQNAWSSDKNNWTEGNNSNNPMPVDSTSPIHGGPIGENADSLNIGDPVVISGDVTFKGKTGEIADFGRDKRFVVVNLYNYGKHSFHSSDVSYNSYADSDQEEADMYDSNPDFRRWAAGQEVDESLADEFMKMAQAKGMNPRLRGTPDEERARTQQMLAQRAKERDAAAAQAAADDVKILPQLKAEYDALFKKYNSLGGRNWQYADREQNLSDGEREARSIEPKLNQLAGRIARAEKSQGVAEGSNKENMQANYKNYSTQDLLRMIKTIKRDEIGIKIIKAISSELIRRKDSVAEGGHDDQFSLGGEMPASNKIPQDSTAGQDKVQAMVAQMKQRTIDSILDKKPEWGRSDLALMTAAELNQILRDIQSGKMTEAEYQGRKVALGKPMAGDVKKSKVYVRKPNGKAVDKMSQAEKVKKGLAHPDTLKKKGVAEGRFDEPLTGWHIVYRKSGNPVHATPSFETKDQAQKYLMTKMFANHQDYKVVHTAGVGVAEGSEQNYLSQIPNLTWKPVSRSVWNTIQDEGLDDEQNAPNHTDWLMASLSISPKDAQALQAFDDDAIEDFNRFDIHLKSRYPGLVDLIDYDRGTVTIVKAAKEQGVAESFDYEREPLYHATLKAFEPSIMKSGLLPGGNLRMFDWSDSKYVYLSNYPDIARDFVDPGVIEPDQAHEEQIFNLMKQGGVILKIDQNKLNRQLLSADPHFNADEDDGAETYIYSGVIPPSAIIGKQYFSINESKQGVAEVSDKTLTSYLTKVHADSQKHDKDPTKRSAEKRNRSVQGFSRAFNKLDSRKEQGVEEGMLDNPGQQDSPVAAAITRRILLQRTDLLAKYGPEKVGAAVDEVADFVGTVDEIGSSDVSGWVRHIEQMLGNMSDDVSEGTVAIELNGRAVDPRSIELAGVHRWDHPDYSDAYIEYAEFTDGTPLSDQELDQLTDERGDIVNQMAHDSLYEDLYEDWQKVNRRDKTDGMSSKAVKAYRREHPGSKLKTAVTTKPSKLKKGSKSAKRRKSFCARMKGMKKAHASAKTKRNPDSPINKALRRWNCESVEELKQMLENAERWYAEKLNEEKVRLDPKCWSGKKIGNPKTKMKGGVRVNNCVPKEGVAEGSLEEIDRRGFLKGLGGAALGATALGAAGKAQANQDQDLGNGFVLTTIDVLGGKFKAVLDTQSNTHYMPNRHEGGNAIVRSIAPFITIKNGQINTTMSVGPATQAAMKKAGLLKGIEEGDSGAKYKVKSIGHDSKGDYYISPSTGKKVYKKANRGDHENPNTGEIKPKVKEAGSPAQQAAIAISMKKAGKKPKTEAAVKESYATKLQHDRELVQHRKAYSLLDELAESVGFSEADLKVLAKKK